MAKVARVTLEGLTVLTQVCRIGDEIPFDELPTYLKRLVKAGQHPHLEYVDATVVEEVPGEDEGESKAEKTVKGKAAPKGKPADEDKSAKGGSQEEPEAGKDEPDKAAKE